MIGVKAGRASVFPTSWVEYFTQLFRGHPRCQRPLVLSPLEAGRHLRVKTIKASIYADEMLTAVAFLFAALTTSAFCTKRTIPRSVEIVQLAHPRRRSI